ncbi:MAG TPA: GTPase Era [Kiritimatiellia bacterium]|nr:GTPase Era [Kiritimatiellia bacterium]HMO97483.1 GTPase Era [Kiritimatiellia bacterium]HMP96292.1 GTPase Era [Kiritimatiellia bacterium]
MSQEATENRRVGMVAVVGRANVGKSSLSNALLGEKLSIVSPVAQTTRNVIRGVLTDARGQLVLVDTPGLHKAPGELGKVMNRLARSSVEGVDAIVLVVDASAPPRDEDEGWMRRLVREELPIVIALNKTDLGRRHESDYRERWRVIAAESGREVPEPRWFPVSAVSGDGQSELLDALFAGLPLGPLLFPEDIFSDYPRKLAIADVIREKLFLSLREELPHAIAVWVEKLEDEGPEWHVRAIIYVNKYSQKGIVIGEKGRMLRKAKRSSEAELSNLYEVPVTVELWVKVEKDWSRNFWLLKKFGYVG